MWSNKMLVDFITSVFVVSRARKWIPPPAFALFYESYLEVKEAFFSLILDRL